MPKFLYRLLEVDLSSGKERVLEYDEEVLRSYFGGSGLASSLLFERFDSSLDAFHPESPLVFMTGLLTGVPVPCGCRVSLCGKSPLGHWGEANAGGYWGAELKFTGFDGLIVVGKSKEPSYLYVTSEGCEIHNASCFWGKGIFETTSGLLVKTDPKARIAAIGPAGENLSFMAGVITGGTDARVMARTGLGAVMGSKNLKAVVVKGDRKPTLYDSKIIKEATQVFLPNLTYVENLRKFGTASVLESKEAIGVLPVKNFQMSHWDGARKISGPAIKANYLTKDYGCFACPICCGKEIRINEGPYSDIMSHGPEYETLSSLGSLVMNDDLNSIIILNNLCNDLGLDTMSAGITVGFAIEAFERGFLKETDGLDLNWGNSDAIALLVRKIAWRQGIGAVLADGVEKASKILGKETEAFALHSKGLEVSQGNPTLMVSLALGWATSNRGACHLEAFSHHVEGGVPFPEEGYLEGLDQTTPEGKGRLTALMQNYMAVFNSLGLCKFLFFARISQSTICQWIKGLAGWELTGRDLMRVGERIYNLKRTYNVLMGINSKDDNVPVRILEILRAGSTIEEGARVFLDMRREYYGFRGWDEQGIPKRETLASLGLDEAIETIYPSTTSV